MLEARSSGQGQVVDAAMVDGTALLMAPLFAAAQMGFWRDRGTNMLDGGWPHCDTYTCADDTQKQIKERIAEHGLNRVVVASCTPRTHEPIFREMLRDAGLNPYLLEMANIREQCSWVHSTDRNAATEKADDIVRIAVARARHLEPQKESQIPVTDAIVGSSSVIRALRRRRC